MCVHARRVFTILCLNEFCCHILLLFSIIILWQLLIACWQQHVLGIANENCEPSNGLQVPVRWTVLSIIFLTGASLRWNPSASRRNRNLKNDRVSTLYYTVQAEYFRNNFFPPKKKYCIRFQKHNDLSLSLRYTKERIIIGFVLLVSNRNAPRCRFAMYKHAQKLFLILRNVKSKQIVIITNYDKFVVNFDEYDTY